LNALTVAANLNATANGLISDNGNITVGGTTTLAAGGANDIVLDNADDFVGAVTIVSANNATLNDVNTLNVGATVNGTLTTTAGSALTVGGSAGGSVVANAGTTATLNALTAGGNLNVTANGDITDNGNVSIAGSTALAAGAGNDITLDNADDFGGAVNIVSGLNVTLNDVNSLTVGGTISGNLGTTAGGGTAFNAATVAGTLNTAANGPITDNGNLTVAGTTTLAAGAANDITLDNANDFVGAVTVTSGRNVNINDVNALTIAATASGNLTTTAGGALVVGGSAGNDLTALAGGTATLNAITIGGNANVTAGGDITDSGDVNVAGNSSFRTAGGRDIILDSAGNTFGGSVQFSSTDVGNLNNVTINDSDVTGFDIALLALDGTFDVRSGGNITQSGGITAAALKVASAGSVTLGNTPIAAGVLPYGFDNAVDSVSATVSGEGNAFLFNGHNRDASTDLNVGPITTQNGLIAIQSDRININGAINAGGADVWLQPVNNVNVVVGGNIPGGDATLVLNSTELHQITANNLFIGHQFVPLLTQDVSLHIQPGNVFDQDGPLNQNNIILLSARSAIADLSAALAGLSEVNIPLPKLEAFSFSGANVTAEEARKLLPEGSIGELFLQLPMPVVEEAKYKVEENSKWTPGRVAASGATAGPQTPR
jgi:hypothetical protein